ncbi:2519_t:CDS:1 [Dentiscutata erythropus]|uniref:2519_t:CDS:1 n=1 Tax=Dentiscutata erythropus TaxID=1348616 RepID=A0A9N9IDX4_9GLOM|nr:2519_t:CDS:1 [Dentiscutata erythropus]
MNLQTLENIAKVYQYNISQIETVQTENNELNTNDIYALVNSMLYDFEDDNSQENNSQDDIDQLSALDSSNTTIDNLELSVKTFIDFNSQIFESFNKNKDGRIENMDFGTNDIEAFEDYDPKTIIQNMRLDKIAEFLKKLNIHLFSLLNLLIYSIFIGITRMLKLCHNIFFAQLLL